MSIDIKYIHMVLLILFCLVLSGCFDLESKVEIHKDGSGSVSFAFITDMMLAGAFEKENFSGAKNVRNFIRNGKFYHEESQNFSSLSELDLEDGELNIKEKSFEFVIPPQRKAQEKYKEADKAASFFLFRGHLITYNFLLPDEINKAYPAEINGIEVEPIVKDNKASWKIPLELLAAAEKEVRFKAELTKPFSTLLSQNITEAIGRNETANVQSQQRGYPRPMSYYVENYNFSVTESRSTITSSTIKENLRYFIEEVLPYLPDEKGRDYQLVAWWAYIENILIRQTVPWRYSNCKDNKKYDPNEDCDGMWQVGYGVQVWDNIKYLKKAVEKVHPYGTIKSIGDAVLEMAGQNLQFPRNLNVDTIVNNPQSITDEKSNAYWASVLMRDPKISAYLEAGVVTDWRCYGKTTGRKVSIPKWCGGNTWYYKNQVDHSKMMKELINMWNEISPISLLAVNPSVSMQPASGTTEGTFTVTGKGFYPNSNATIYGKRPDGSFWQIATVATDSTGAFTHTWTAKTTGNNFTWWAVDNITAKKSNEVVYNITLNEPSKAVFPATTAEVTDVIDGDTLEVDYNNEIRQVRLIGIDTPEVKVNEKTYHDANEWKIPIPKVLEMGDEATMHVEHLVKKGDRIRLEFDEKGPRVDPHNRLLGYVYLKNGLFLNAELLKNGYARTFFRDWIDGREFEQKKYNAEFQRIEEEARRNRVGFWVVWEKEAPTSQGGAFKIIWDKNPGPDETGIFEVISIAETPVSFSDKMFIRVFETIDNITIEPFTGRIVIPFTNGPFISTKNKKALIFSYKMDAISLNDWINYLAFIKNSYGPIQRLTVYAHGNKGIIYLTKPPLDWREFKKDSIKKALARLKTEQILAPSAHILLFSCLVGQDEGFVQELANLTGAWIHANRKAIGYVLSDWSIEIVKGPSTGEISLKASPPWSGDFNGPIDLKGRKWFEIDYDDSDWAQVSLPDNNSFYSHNPVDRFYRASLNLSGAEGIQLNFSSDDGIWIYVNGRFLGHWGGQWRKGGCVNNPQGKCVENVNIQPIVVPSNLILLGKNVIAIRVSNGGYDSYFDMRIHICPK
ncbi:MAG: thermonuclease family protein [Nitrospirota bacterium]